MSIYMYQQHAGVNWVVNIQHTGNKVCLFTSQCYWFWVYRSLSEGSYAVPAINNEWGDSKDGLYDLDCAHDPKLTSNLSLVRVMIFWFTWCHPYSLNVLHSAFGFDYPRSWYQYYFWPVRPVTSCPFFPYVNSEYSTSKLFLQARCVTRHFCQCFVRLKDVRSCEPDVPYSSNDSRGGPDGSGGKSIMVDSMHRCVREIIIKMIPKTWYIERGVENLTLYLFGMLCAYVLG